MSSVILDHPELEPFEPLLRKIHTLAFTGGIDALASRGLTMKDIEHDESARKRFIRGCHYGYDRAQQQIASAVIGIENARRSLAAEIRQLRSSRDERIVGALAREHVLSNRQLVLRRLADALIFTIVGFNPWIAKRFIAQQKTRPIDPEVLRRTVDYAFQLNAESRYLFALVSDLTTIIDVGDLLQIDLSPGSRRQWKLIELKHGRVNALLSEIIQDPSTAEDEQMDRIRSSLGDRGVRQARRMRRQQLRLEEVDKILKTDSGTDLVLNRQIVLTREVFEAEDYVAALHHVISVARTTGVGVASVDGCLRLAAIQATALNPKAPMFGVAHLFYHWRRSITECALPDSAGLQSEIDAVASDLQFVDLLAHSMHVRWSYPVFVWMLEPEELFDVLMGRVRVFAQFDIHDFIGRIEALGFRTTWITGKQAEGLKQLSGHIPGSPDARALRVESGEVRIDYLVGFFGRIFTELMRPADLLRMLRLDVESKLRQ